MQDEWVPFRLTCWTGARCWKIGCMGRVLCRPAAEVESSEGGHLLPSSVPPGLESWLPVQADVGFSSRESPSFLRPLGAEAPAVEAAPGGLRSHQPTVVLRPLGDAQPLSLGGVRTGRPGPAESEHQRPQDPAPPWPFSQAPGLWSESRPQPAPARRARRGSGGELAALTRLLSASPLPPSGRHSGGFWEAPVPAKRDAERGVAATPGPAPPRGPAPKRPALPGAEAGAPGGPRAQRPAAREAARTPARGH